ncbi:phosphoribosylglycinamide formyltransferase [Haliangium sp.]|uniref:phosphoribosylglycinamide formyltransferase n=1 Tax=Haliangium sp. TaxID=2663208 RepID=UPI003D0993D6
MLASGRGSNLQALLDAQADGTLAPAEIVLALCNRPGAPALDRARAAGVEALCIDHQGFPDRRGFEDAMLAALAERGVEAVVLAGFMRILSGHFLQNFPARVINTHPSLLPAFPGLDAPAQALAHGVKVTGCTVHFVDAGVDTGPIIAQASVPVLDDDDAGSLHRRIQAQEHALLPEVTRTLATGALLCEGRRVRRRPPG